MFFNLQKKLLFFFIVLATLPFVVVGYIQLNITEQELINTINDRLSFVSEDLSNKIDDIYNDQLAHSLELLKKILQNNELSENTKLNLLKEIINYEKFISIQLSTKENNSALLAVHDKYRSFIKKNIYKDLFKKEYSSLDASLSEKGLFISSPLFFNGTNEWFISVSSKLEKKFNDQPTILTFLIPLNALLRTIKSHPFNKLGRIELLDKQGNLLFSENKTINEKNNFINTILELQKNNTRAVNVAPFINQGREMLGAYSVPQKVEWIVLVIRDKTLAYLPVSKMIQNLLFWSSLGILFALLGAQYFAQIVSDPIVKIDRVAEKVKEGNFDVKVPEYKSNDEIGHLTVQFNKMIDGLKERERVKDIFGRYQSKELVDKLLNSSKALSLGGERKELTLLMSDIRGFTTLSENHHAEEVIAILNNYFEIMIDIMEKYNGTLNEIVGDALFVIFGAPTLVENHADKAIACAIEMQQAMKTINEENLKNSRTKLEIGIGINTGEVIVGNIGSNKRTKYGVVGTDVNLAGRIESYSVGGQILISKQTYKKCKANLKFGNKFKVHPKGVADPISIFEVKEISSPYSLKLDPIKKIRTKLLEGIPISYKIISDKHINRNSYLATIIELGKETAVIKTNTSLSLFNNILITLMEKEPISSEIYAKIIKVNQGTYKIAFASIPDELYNSFSNTKPIKNSS